MITQATNEYIENFLQDFKAEGLSEQEQTQMLDLVRDRLQDVSVAVLLSMLNEKDRVRFAEAIEKDPVPENEISEIAAGVPGLQPALEIALSREYEAIKKAYRAK